MDLPELGNGAEASTTPYKGGASSATRPEPSERLRQQRRDAKRRYYLKNKATINAKTVQYRRENRERLKPTGDAWRERNKDHILNYGRKYHSDHKESRAAQSKASRERHADRIKLERKEKRKLNRDAINAKQAVWRAANPDKLKIYHKRHHAAAMARVKLRRATDPVQRIKDACRTRVGFILKKAGIPKFDHTFELVGCSPDFLKAFIEAQFKPGMSWDNYGEWELDHRIPIANFDLSNRQQRLAAFHYSNCQPLWKFDNRSKNDTLPGPHQALLI